MKGRVAVVDDDPTIQDLLRYWLSQAGYDADAYDRGSDLLSGDLSTLAMVCLDLTLRGESGFDTLKHLHARDPDLPVVVITGDHDLQSAVVSMRDGAYDYVVKPLTVDRFLFAVGRAVERRQLTSSVRRLENERGGGAPRAIVGESVAMRELVRQVQRVADSELAVAIVGETGTGKELVAQAIHEGSPRRAGPFIALNCAAIPPSLQESELFGHERGAFTGATHTRRGAFELASGGTIFLDELGEMGPTTQASLLRVLQERTVRRIGASTEIPVDCRIVSATNRDLEKEVAAGRFREDLFYRLVIYPILVPPLREHPDDIPMLAGHFLRKLSASLGSHAERIHPDALEALMRHEWPGNVRELQNVISRAMVACDGAEIGLSHLPKNIRELQLPAMTIPTRATGPIAPAQSMPPQSAAPPGPPKEEDIVPIVALERREILRALQATRGNVARAAKLLGLGRATLYRRIAELEGDAQLTVPIDRDS